MDDLKIGIIIAQILNFWILFFGFKYFLGDKIVAAIEERRKHVKASEAAEWEAETQREAAELEAQQIIDGARTKATEIEKYANEISKQNAEKALNKAKTEAEHILNSGKAQVEKEKLDMLQVMKEKVVGLSLKINAKVFGTQTANQQFMEKEYDVLTK